MYRPWTKSELVKLKMIADGQTNIKIKGRSYHSVRSKIWKMGLKKSNRFNNHWTEQEIELLVQGLPVPGRTAKSTDRKRVSLGLLKQKPRYAWPEDHIKLLKQAWEQGLSSRQIHERGILPKNYSVNAIQKKMCNMGFVTRRLSFIRFDANTKAIFEQFLIDNWRGQTPQDLTEAWNKKYQNYPVSHRRVIKYLTILGIKVPQSEVVIINNQRRFEQKARLNEENIPLAEVELKIKRNRMKIMRERMSNNRDIWTGLDMGMTETEDS